MVEEEEDKKLIPLYSLLPPPVRRRIRALKKIQYQTILLEAKFFQDVHKLECKYANLYSQGFTRRENIVTGSVEPNDDDCDFNEGYESPDDEDPTVKELRSRLSITKQIESGAGGIPEFWLTVLKNVELTSDMVFPHDEPILRHLTDIKVSLRENDPMGFTLAFHFAPNPYFSNKVLTKEYEMKCAPDQTTPWMFEGPEIVKAKGCTIDWQKGMDVTMKTIQKKQRHKTKGSQVRTVLKTVKNDSFFNFFNPVELPEDPGEGFPYEEVQSLQDLDYEVGSFIREKLVPHAVLYYTGEALEDESESEESSSEEESGEERGGDADENEDECSSDRSSEDAGSGDAGSDIGH